MQKEYSKEMKELIAEQDDTMRYALSHAFKTMKWDPRTLELEKLLHKKGFDVQLYYGYVLPHEIAYNNQERRPDDAVHQAFMQRLAILGLEAGYISKGRTLVEKFKMGVRVLGKKEAALEEINKYFDEVQKNNPDLNIVTAKAESVFDKYNILIRVLDGYSPKDIVFFETYRKILAKINEKDKGVLENKENMEKRIATSKKNFKAALERVDLGQRAYTLSPETMDVVSNKIVSDGAKSRPLIKIHDPVRTI